MRKLNLAVFPVKYNDKFYSDLYTPEKSQYTQLGERRHSSPRSRRRRGSHAVARLRPGYFSDILVGAICSRYEPLDGPKFKVYIMTIGVLVPYRRLSIGERRPGRVPHPASPHRRPRGAERARLPCAARTTRAGRQLLEQVAPHRRRGR